MYAFAVPTVQHGQRCAQVHQHVLDQHRRALQQMDAAPEPDHDADDAREKYRLHGHPDFGETCDKKNSL